LTTEVSLHVSCKQLSISRMHNVVQVDLIGNEQLTGDGGEFQFTEDEVEGNMPSC